MRSMRSGCLQTTSRMPMNMKSVMHKMLHVSGCTSGIAGVGADADAAGVGPVVVAAVAAGWIVREAAAGVGVEAVVVGVGAALDGGVDAAAADAGAGGAGVRAVVSAGIGAGVKRVVGDDFASDVDVRGAGVDADADFAGVGAAVSAGLGARAVTDVGAGCDTDGGARVVVGAGAAAGNASVEAVVDVSADASVDVDVGAGVDAGCDSGVSTGGWVESCLGMVRLELRRWAVSPEHSVTVQRPGYSIDCPRTMPRRPLMGFWSWPWTITSVPAWSRGGIQEASREWTARRCPMVAGFGPRYRSRCNRAFPGLALALEVAAGRTSGANAPESAA